jgi:Domain of unknown function (DUF4905)
MEEIINHNFNGKIWNSSFSEEYCVLEIRDESTRQVSFSCINLLTGNILWQNLKPEKSWWLSLVEISDEYLFLHKYSSNQKPEPEGLLVINVLNSEIVLKLEDAILYDYRQNILTISDKQSKLKSIKLGPPRKSKDSVEGIIKVLSEKINHYSEDSPHFPTIYKFLYRLLNIDAVKAVDYLEISNKIIISYYIYRDKSFLNYLLVTNRSRQILLNDLIAETEGIGIDTFTVKSDTLLYVKNQTQFVGYRL